MKFLVDMNMSRRWIQAFNEAGLEAIHWSEVGDVRAPDAEIMDYAVLHGLIVFTKDLYFGAMLAGSRNRRPSVVQVRAGNASPEVVGPQVLIALRKMEDEIEARRVTHRGAPKHSATLATLRLQALGRC